MRYMSTEGSTSMTGRKREGEDSDAHGCCNDIQAFSPQLDVLVLADSRDTAITRAFTREQPSRRDIEDLGEQCP